MSDQDAFERILASLYDAMLDDAHWPTTATLIDAACGTRGNCLLVGEGPQDAVQAHFLGAYYRGGRREDLEREYLDIYYPIDERVPRVLHLPDSHLAHITELYTPEELQTSPTYNEFLHRAGGQNGLNVRLDGPDGSHLVWVFVDPVARGDWASPQLALITGLLPHIRQFIRVRQALVSAGALGASVTELLDTSRMGVIYLDQRGRVVVANDRARALLRYGDGLSDRSRFLRARDPADHARLKRLVAGALPAPGVAAVSGLMTLRRAVGVLPLVVHIKPVVSPPPDLGMQRVAALVLLVEPGRQPRLNPTLVAEALGLTPAESQVAIWLAEGQTVREIAVATGRTASAIHYHLHQIYQKQRISRQADLVRLVLSLVEVV